MENNKKMVSYYVSYSLYVNGQNVYGCVSLDTQELKDANGVLKLANDIANILNMPKNSVIILFFKEFSVDKTPKIPDNGWN